MTEYESIRGLKISRVTVFIADTGKAVYVWIGSGASKDEKKQAMTYAHVSTISQYCTIIVSSLLRTT